MFKILKHKIYLVFSVIVLSMISNISFTEEIKNTEDIKNVAEIKNVEEVKNTEDIKITEEIKNTEDIKNVAEIKNVEEVKNTEDIKNVAEIKNVEEVKNKNYLIEDDSIITEDTYLKNKEKENFNATEQKLKSKSGGDVYIYQHMPVVNGRKKVIQDIIKKKAKKHVIFINLGFRLGYSMQTEFGKGNYNKDEWFNGESYKSNTFGFYQFYGVDYAFLRSKFFNPLIGLFLDISLSDFVLHKNYSKIVSTTNDKGLKKMWVETPPRIDIGIKLGNVILLENSNMIIPYISAGYSYRTETLKADYKVEPYKETYYSRSGGYHTRIVDHKTKTLDRFSNHFVFVGTGIDYNISIFKIGIYAKFYYPINNTILKDQNQIAINFGKRLMFSSGLTLAISVPNIY